MFNALVCRTGAKETGFHSVAAPLMANHSFRSRALFIWRKRGFMASNASRWNEDDSPLAGVHGGTAKAALRAISESKALYTTPPHIVAKERKDRMRRKTLVALKDKGFRVFESDVAAPFLPDWSTRAPASAKSGITATHVKVWDRCGGLCHGSGRAA